VFQCVITILCVFVAPTSPRDVFTKHFVDFKTIVQLKDFVDHFVSKKIINMDQKDTVTMESLLRNIDSQLEHGYLGSFYEMLKVLKNVGNITHRELVERVEHELCALEQEISIDDFSELFNIDDRVEDMFLALFSALGDIFKSSKCEFSLLRTSCVKPDMPLARGNKLPSDFVNKVDATTNLTDLLQVLNKSPFCNWLNIRVLEKMAAASRKPEAKSLIAKYKNMVLSKKVSDILQEMPDLEIPSEFYVEVKDKWNKDFEDITVKDITKHWSKLQKIFDVEDLELLLENLIKGSIEFQWLIPIELMCHVRYSALRNWHELKDVSYLCIGDHVIKDERFNFTKEHLSVTTGMYLY